MADPEIIVGGPPPQVLAKRAGEVADAMDEILASIPVQEVRSILDVALEGEPDAVEAPKPAPLSAPVSEPNTAPVGVLAAPEEPSGVRLTSAAMELKKVPLGAAATE